MAILSTIRRRTLTTKLTITTTILTVVVVAVLSGFFIIQQKGRTYAELKKRGLSLAKTTAYNSEYGVAIGDEETLLRLIMGIEVEEDVAYVIIQDTKGNVLAKTNTGIEPEAVTGQVNKRAVNVEEFNINTWNPEGESRVYDISVPVILSEGIGNEPAERGVFDDDVEVLYAQASLRGKAGVVRIGMSLKTAEAAIQQSIIVTVLLTIGLVILSIFSTGKIVVTMLSPLRQLLLTVQTVGTGDLTAQIEEQSTNEEIGQLASAFRQMQNSLKGMVRQIQSSYEVVNSSVSELTSSSRKQAKGAREQSTSLAETSSTVEELATVSKQIAENAQKVAEMAEQSLAGMEVIRENTTQGANRILTLDEKSQSIGEVVGMIDDITRQTNLLALNASIEAARAGEAGRGFAVVATEIRKLATNVANSTDQIREIIKDIQDAANASVLATENVGKSVEDGIKISKFASESANQISVATHQQRSASDQMVATIKEMVVIAEETSIGSSQIAETANRLAQATKEQKKLVEQFKIG